MKNTSLSVCMHAVHLSFFIQLFAFFKADAQLKNVWTAVDTAPKKSWGMPVKLQADDFGNSYLLVKYEVTNGQADVAIIKYDSTGKLKWKKIFATTSHNDLLSFLTDSTKQLFKQMGVSEKYLTSTLKESFDDRPVDLKIDHDGNVYLLAISYLANSSGKFYYVVIKYDKSGREIWKSFFDKAFTDFNGNDAALTVTAKEEIYVIGSSFAYKNPKGKQILVIKYDKYGKDKWHKLIEEDTGYIPYKPISAVNDHGKLCIFYRAQSNEVYHFYMAEMDSSGNNFQKMFVKSFVGSLAEEMNYFILPFDPQDFFFSTTLKFKDLHTLYFRYLYREPILEFSYPAASKNEFVNFTDLVIDANRNIICLASKKSRITEPSNFLLKYDKEGKLIFKTDLPVAGDNHIAALQDGQTIVGGFTSVGGVGFSSGKQFYFLLRLNALGKEDGFVVIPGGSNDYHKNCLQVNKRNEIFFAYMGLGGVALKKYK